MKSVIIDNGIDIKTLAFYANDTRNLMVNKGEIIPSNPPSELTHGGLCARVFAEQSGNLPDISIHLSRDDTHKSNSDDLITALEWCAGNKIKLISLSMGTIRFSDAEALKKAVDLLYNKGIILITAANNNGFITFPAVFDSCIGVSCHYELNTEEIVYFENSFDGINIATHHIHSPELKAKGSNSLSAAFIAGMICKEINFKSSFDDVHQLFIKKSKKR